MKLVRGPTSIRRENGQLVVYLFVDIRDRDIGGFVADAQKAVAEAIQLLPRSYVVWSGQFEYLEGAQARMRIVVPVTLFIMAQDDHTTTALEFAIASASSADLSAFLQRLDQLKMLD